MLEAGWGGHGRPPGGADGKGRPGLSEGDTSHPSSSRPPPLDEEDGLAIARPLLGRPGLEAGLLLTPQQTPASGPRFRRALSGLGHTHGGG